MAELQFLLQALTRMTHAEALRQLLRTKSINSVLMSVAFAQELGISALSSQISAVASKTQIYVGIRNEITSIQAIEKLLKLKVCLYAVDTGARIPIFHPKLYIARSSNQARAIVGSANLTFSGLHNNIEASAIVKFDLGLEHDLEFVDSVFDRFSELESDYPENVFRISSLKQAKSLFDSGRLMDENVPLPPRTNTIPRAKDRDTLHRMKLHQTPRPKRKSNTPAGASQVKARSKVKAQAKGLALPTSSVPRTTYQLVWVSNGLTRRDLNIPASKNTKRTGSMGMKKGAIADIDQRHYFRDEVFDSLHWIKSANSDWERARAKFEIVIKNLSYGIIELELSHNTNKDSASYKQRNFMTQLHWGGLKPQIAKPDLLGRVFRLYRDYTANDEYLIEID